MEPEDEGGCGDGKGEGERGGGASRSGDVVCGFGEEERLDLGCGEDGVVRERWIQTFAPWVEAACASF